MALYSIIKGLDRLTEATGRSLAWLNVGMVVLTFSVVVLRYAFNYSPIVLQESIMYLHAIVFMLASAYTLKHNEHVRVDIFYQQMGLRGKAAVDLAGTLLLLIPTMGFIAIISWPYIESAWHIREASQEAAGLPFVYILKSLIVVMAAVMILQAVAEVLRQLGTLLGLPVPQDSHTGDMV